VPPVVRRLPVLLAAGGVLVAVVVVATPVLDVRTVDVDGASGATRPTADKVAASVVGTSLLRVDVDDIEQQILDASPVVEAVSVEREFPGTLRLRVSERVPVLAMTEGSRRFGVSADGVVFPATSRAKVPPLQVSSRVDGEQRAIAIAAAARATAALPEAIRGTVRSVTVRSRDDIRTRIARGPEIRWGDATEIPRKAAVVAALLSTGRGVAVIDVSAPDLPTTRT
jgi:cell division protein FtsQ